MLVGVTVEDGDGSVIIKFGAAMKMNNFGECVT